MSTEKTEEKIVMYDSPEAASIKTVTGWVSRTGRFWGEDQHMARFDGCTHKRCECGEVLPVHSGCMKCHDRKELDKYLAMPRLAWDGKTPLHLHNTDRYFFDADDLAEYCVERGKQAAELALVICVPRYASQIDPSEHYADDLPEDGDIPPELEAAFMALNAAIQACKTPLCWFPGKYAVTPESLPVINPAAEPATA